MSSEAFAMEKGSTDTLAPKAQNDYLHRIMEHITTFVHIITVLFTLFILYLALQAPFTLFTWHPVLFAFGWVLLMTESILTLTGDNIFSTFLSHKNRVLVHWILQTAAVGLSLGGFVVVYLNKENAGKHHFTSLHGIVGLTSVISMICTFVIGLPALFSVELRKYIPPRINKFAHILLGFLTYLVGGVELILALYTGWFKRQVNETTFVVSFIALVIIILWTLLKPALNLLRRSKNLF